MARNYPMADYELEKDLDRRMNRVAGAGKVEVEFHPVRGENMTNLLVYVGMADEGLDHALWDLYDSASDHMWLGRRDLAKADRALQALVEDAEEAIRDSIEFMGGVADWTDWRLGLEDRGLEGPAFVFDVTLLDDEDEED